MIDDMLQDAMQELGMPDDEINNMIDDYHYGVNKGLYINEPITNDDEQDVEV